MKPPKTPRSTASTFTRLAGIALAAWLAAAPLACAPSDAAPEPVAEMRAALGPTIRIAGRVANSGSVPVAGVKVQLNGSLQRTAVTDSNGSYLFEIPAGSYSLNPSKTGAVLVPDVVNLNNLAADRVQDFACTSGCNPPASIVAAKELVITDPTVLGDARASNASSDGRWSFRSLIEQMTPIGMDPADLAGNWLLEFTSPPPPNQKTINGFPVDNRDITAVTRSWPTQANGKLDLSRAPFVLRAIVNRTDLHAGANGELRFVFGFVGDLGGGITSPMGFTAIFEFGLPSADPTTGQPLARKDWIAKLHTLSVRTFGVDFNPALQAITDLVTRRNSSPARPNGSALNQLRSNEVIQTPGGTAAGGIWQAREFHLVAGTGGGLKLASPAQTPDDSAAQAGTAANLALTNYVLGDATRIRVGLASVPATIIGGQATESFSWRTFAAPVDESARRAFAGQTCSGCHLSENFTLNIDTFYLITPFTDANGGTRLSSFVTQIEEPRRAIFIENQLACTGSACAAGAEPMLQP